jgi:hypothetical protein
VLDNSGEVRIFNNQIDLTGTGTTEAIYVENKGAVNFASVTVRDNDLHAGANGTGLYLNSFKGGSNFQIVAQGNDFHGNHVGVAINGPGLGSDAGEIDLGGGSTMQLGTSLGGNNFRGFDGLNGHFAIHLFDTDATATVSAQHNIFDNGVNPHATVADKTINGGTGIVDVSAALDANHAFVQTLYHDLLGRTGSSAELDGWVSELPGLGHAGVVHDILYGDAIHHEALDRLVGGYYQRFLGRADNGSEELGWINALQGGAMTLEQVQAGFVASAEYQSHINTDFVQSLYMNVLHRSASTTELAGWNNALPQLGLGGVVAGFTNSFENRVDTATQYYQDLLHRAPQPGEASSLATGVQGDLLALETAVMSGPEYNANG